MRFKGYDFQAFEESLIVKPITAMGRTDSGIYFPDGGDSGFKVGQVMSVGEYFETYSKPEPNSNTNYTIRPGDSVLFFANAGSTIKDDQGIEHRILGPKEVRGVSRKPQ